MTVNDTDTPKKQEALSRILQVVSSNLGKGTMYIVATLGMIALVPEVNLPENLKILASGLGLNLLATIIDRVAHNVHVSDQEIVEQIEEVFSKSGIEQLLTRDDFWHAFAHLRKDQRSLDEKLGVIFQTLQRIEQTGPTISPVEINVPLLVKKVHSYVGRSDDISAIIKILSCKSAPTSQVLVLFGLRGVGKSTLAEMVCESLHERFQSVKRYNLNKNFDLSAFYYWLRKLIPPKELVEQGYRQFARAIALEIASLNLLLVLDGSEILTDSTSGLIEASQIGFSELIDALLETDLGSSRVIITGWRKFNTLSGYSIRGYRVKGLNTEAAIDLLQNYGVNASHDALILAARKTRGHPQTLIWLAALLSPPSMYTVEMACSDDGIWHPEYGEVACKVLDKVFLDSLSELEKSILADLWVFDEPVPIDVLSNFNQGNRNDAEVYRAVNILAQKAMLTVSDDRRIMLDDLVSDFIFQRIINQEERHSKAADWYLSLPRITAEEWGSREDTFVTIKAIYHLTLAHRQSDAMELIKSRQGIGSKLTFFGMHNERIRMAEDLLDPKISGIWSLALFDKAWLMRLAGFSYAVLGDYNRGQELIEEALSIFLSLNFSAENLGPDNVVVCLNSLGKIALWKGAHNKSVEYHEQALIIIEKYGIQSPEYTYTDIAEAKIYGYYETRNEGLLNEVIEWGNKALGASRSTIDNIARSQACRSEAFALLGSRTEAIRSALKVLDIIKGSENLYSRLHALRAIAISAQTSKPELSTLALDRAQQLCTDFGYLYGQARNDEITQYIEKSLHPNSNACEGTNSLYGKELDDLIIQQTKSLLTNTTEVEDASK